MKFSSAVPNTIKRTKLKLAKKKTLQFQNNKNFESSSGSKKWTKVSSISQTGKWFY